ncbi:nitrogen fixation negative regulator NifL [Vibrio sp. MA40-2]|uniref:nitrogen fixation negative regulator NifL n=1 Tax=Vibrio sp. MA40-2 TaxID=3391828 RepID=UPI0039A68930
MKSLQSIEHEPVFNHFGSSAFEQIVINAPIAISITDQLGNILLVNQNFTEVTGYSMNEVVGKNCSILSYKTTPKSIYQNLWTTITKGEHWQGQLINKKKNGELYISDISISSLTNEQGEIFYYAIHKDITEQHRLQTHEKNQAALFQVVLNSVPIAIALVDKNNNALFSNKKYEVLKDNLHQDPISLLLDYLKMDYELNSIEDYLSHSNQKYKGVHIDGTDNTAEHWFDYALAKIPVTDTATEAYFQPVDEFYTVVGIIDRSKEKHLIEERRLQNIKLMTGDEKFVHAMQEAMMATLHQLQGPLNMISSAITILKQNNHACPGIVAMDEAMFNALGALEDIKQAIPERKNEAKQPVNLNQLVRDTLAVTTTQLLHASIELDLKLTPSLPSITGKPNRLLLALKQIIDNAIDAIQLSRSDQRTLLITTRESVDDISITIEDSGAGISEDMHLKVFQPFFSTKPKHQEGSRGIGLAIVQQVINEHSATIQIRPSRRLGGAYFRLTFPKKTK